MQYSKGHTRNTRNKHKSAIFIPLKNLTFSAPLTTASSESTPHIYAGAANVSVRQEKDLYVYSSYSSITFDQNRVSIVVVLDVLLTSALVVLGVGTGVINGP